MRYYILCGGYYMKDRSELPKQLREYGTGITLVERTVNFLRLNGVDDILIVADDDRFERIGLPIFKREYPEGKKHWLDGLTFADRPATYIFGDVFFSPKAIQTIVETKTDDIEFFASAPPFSPEYFKSWAEPFAFKVESPLKFIRCVNTCIELADQGAFKRDPIAWELWQVIKKTPLNVIDYTNYTVINDYTTDFDNEAEFQEFTKRMKGVKE